MKESKCEHLSDDLYELTKRVGMLERKMNLILACLRIKDNDRKD